MEKRFTLTENAAEQRYEFDLGDDRAFVEYVREAGLVVLTHTYVPPRYEGQGIGKRLVEAVLGEIRRKKLRIVPQCAFIAQYIYRHPAWKEIVLKEMPAK